MNIFQKRNADDFSEIESALRTLLAERVAILDGAMGTMVQQRELEEADFRGEAFADHGSDLRGNNDILCLTRPEVITGIHRQFLDSGAEVISTNTFNGTAIAQADYFPEREEAEKQAREINLAAAGVARRAVDSWMDEHPDRRAFVAGAIGPTNRTASLSPDVNNPGYRAITFEQLVEAYSLQARALLEGGADILLVETIFDTLNAKAALFAIDEIFAEIGFRTPLMLSVTITDASGRNLSGQTTEAFWNSVRHSDPLSVGINCALGAEEMRPYVEELSRVAECFTSCYPNAGLPNAFGGYDDTPERMAELLGDFAAQGWVNFVGGCCGTTPEHIAAIAGAVKQHPPRVPAERECAMRLSGLEPLTV